MNSVHNKRDSNPLFDPKTVTETEQNHIIDDNTSINMPVKSAAFTAALQCERNRSPPSNPMEGDTGELGEEVRMGKRKKNDIKVVTFSHIDDIIPHPKPDPNPNSNARVKVELVRGAASESSGHDVSTEYSANAPNSIIDH